MAYLRWRNRRGVLEASIVRSERRNGVPRQVQIARVGNARADEINALQCRARMWAELNAVLDRLQLPADQDAAAVAAFDKVVRHPDFALPATTAKTEQNGTEAIDGTTYSR